MSKLTRDEAVELFKALSKPFDPSVVDFRPGAVTQDRTKAMGLAFVDMRAYFDRLDEVCPGEWETELVPWGPNRIICKLTIRGITRSSLGEARIEDENCGTSAEAQAFKRACTAFGLGRYLYSLPRAWGEYDDKRKRFTENGLKYLRKVCGIEKEPDNRPQAAPQRPGPKPEPAAGPTPVSQPQSAQKELTPSNIPADWPAWLTKELTTTEITMIADLKTRLGITDNNELSFWVRKWDPSAEEKVSELKARGCKILVTRVDRNTGEKRKEFRDLLEYHYLRSDVQGFCDFVNRYLDQG